MKSETLPAGTPSAEAHWVEAELVRSLMRTQGNTQWVGLLLVAVIIGVLWSDVPLRLLAVWGALALAAATWRFWVIGQFERHVLPRGSDEHLAFFRRHSLVWPVSAFLAG